MSLVPTWFNQVINLGKSSPDAAGASSEGSSFRKARNLEQVGGCRDVVTGADIENTLKADGGASGRSRANEDTDENVTSG
jgi:hypothetical protein